MISLIPSPLPHSAALPASGTPARGIPTPISLPSLPADDAGTQASSAAKVSPLGTLVSAARRRNRCGAETAVVSLMSCGATSESRAALTSVAIVRTTGPSKGIAYVTSASGIGRSGMTGRIAVGAIGRINTDSSRPVITISRKPRAASKPELMSQSMEGRPMGMTISIAQRLAERAKARADAHHDRSMTDGVIDDDEEETERDMRATARELEQFADIQDAAHSLAWNGLTERNVRRLHDFAGLKQLA